MASFLTHAVFATALGTAFHQRLRPFRFWLLGAGLSMAPDLDVIGFGLGVPYGAALGHRGASHSILFALVLAAAVASLAGRGLRAAGVGPWRALSCFLLATASHGVLDAATNGGLGVAFLWPLDDSRFFFEFRPLEVSPLALGPFLGPRGLGVLASEALWVWLPATAMAGICLALGKRRFVPKGGVAGTRSQE